MYRYEALAASNSSRQQLDPSTAIALAEELSFDYAEAKSKQNIRTTTTIIREARNKQPSKHAHDLPRTIFFFLTFIHICFHIKYKCGGEHRSICLIVIIVMSPLIWGSREAIDVVAMRGRAEHAKCMVANRTDSLQSFPATNLLL